MKTLYHGSYTEVSAPLAKVGRRNLDFGQGFYLTSIRKQAENWAAIIASRMLSVSRYNPRRTYYERFRALAKD